MTVTSADFLEAAQILLQHGPHEGCMRSCVSRAYYAAFHEARDYCLSQGATVPSRNAHVGVRWCLEEQGHARLASDLKDLHDYRKFADYDVRSPLEEYPLVAQDAIDIATHILSRLSSLSR